MPGISDITITAGPVPATNTSFVLSFRVTSRRSKSARSSAAYRSGSASLALMAASYPPRARSVAVDDAGARRPQAADSTGRSAAMANAKGTVVVEAVKALLAQGERATALVPERVAH